MGQEHFDDSLIVPREANERHPRESFPRLYSETGTTARISSSRTDQHNALVSRTERAVTELPEDWSHLENPAAAPRPDSPSLAKADLTPRQSVIYGRSLSGLEF